MYERIYSVGCFDYFHRGHEILFKRMRELGKTLIIGIHDDTSIRLLKKLTPDQHQSLETRIANIKPFVDHVFIVSSTDPTLFLQAIVTEDDTKETACFVRGNDMPNFPGRKFIEAKIAIQLLPYTEGVSSTDIRKENAQAIDLNVTE